jgi:hypothetical protein
MVAPVNEYPPAICPKCGSQAAVRVPASKVGKSHDFILCYGCGEVSVVEKAINHGDTETQS